MSKIIASAAIRGAYRIVEGAEKKWQQAMDKFGAKEPVGFPNTAYFLPIIYGMLGMKVEKLGDMEGVLKRCRLLLPPPVREEHPLPYLAPALDAGMATFFAEECLEAIRYLEELNFYLLGDELAHAYASVLQGERVWQGLSVTVLHLEKMLDKLMEKHPTGHLCIHKENRKRHYCLFFKGKPLGVYDIEKEWSPVDFASMWEDTKQVDYYLSAQMKSFLSKVEEVSAVEDFWEFITLWNNLVEAITKKLDKKTVKKSLKKQFGGLDMYTLKGISLQPADAQDRSGHDALKTFKLNVPVFLKEMGTFTGNRWLTRQLQDFQKMNGDIIARLSLTKVLLPK